MEKSDTQRDRVLKEALACHEQLIAYAWSLLGNYAAAEDVVQEAMLVVVKKFDQFRDGSSMLAWCRSIVRLEVLRTKQGRRREQSLAERLLDDAIDAAFEEFHETKLEEQVGPWQDALRRCFDRIPLRSQGVLQARFVDELSYQQIAEKVGMSLEAVRKALFRLKRQLRSCVETSLRAAE